VLLELLGVQSHHWSSHETTDPLLREKSHFRFLVSWCKNLLWTLQTHLRMELSTRERPFGPRH
jgi:hypothetical protein